MTKKMLRFILITFLVLPHVTTPTNRQSSFPYISGDSFRALADHLFDETATHFNPNSVQKGDIIFVKSDYLARFFREKHPFISNPYILISHNSDGGAPAEFKHYLESEKIIVWFGQNPTCNHEKFIPIPIGIANRYWPHGNINTFDVVLDFVNSFHGLKKYLLGLNFKPGTNLALRKPIYDHFIAQPYCTNLLTDNHVRYLHSMTQSKFILSPRGNGLDCHRTWEALLMGSVPIVQSSYLDEMFKDLPVLIIHDWSEITKDFLEEKYEEVKQTTYDFTKIFFLYWEDLVLSYKTRFQK